MAAPILDIKGLSVALPEGADRVHAVSDLDLVLNANEILCVVGESGSGKSVMARSVMGLLPRRLRPVAGSITYQGKDLLQVSEMALRDLRGRAISMIFQEPMTALNPLMTIGAQIDEVLLIHGEKSRTVRREKILQGLDDVHLPDPAAIVGAFPHELSGGQRQRAMIAMALVLQPDIIIADEPTTALDVTTQAQILRLIKDLQSSRGTGVLFITHDFGVVAEIADRIAVMKDGELVEFGEAETVLNRPQHAYTKKLIAAIPGSEAHRRPPVEGAQAALSVEELQKVYRGRRGLFGGKARDVAAVKGVSFALRRGETIALVGESGSGKSTVARCIVRLTESDGGRVMVEGEDILGRSKSEMFPFRRRMQMIFQDPFGSLNPRITVGQMIAQGPIIHGVPAAEANRRASELLELVGLDARAAGRYANEFSGGQRQRIGIARALALEPEIIIADEPVSALDVSIQAQVLKLLDSIRDRFNLAMLFITHDLRVAAQVCDRIAVMKNGEIVEFGDTARVFSDPQHPYTRELLDAVPGKDWHNPLSEAVVV